MVGSDYMVDVLMPVYNHEKYLAQAIEGILMQKTNYKFRLVVGEDCSKDSSREILRKYAEANPGVVVPVYHEKNLGATGNGVFLNQMAEAKYVAVCEGDDYWTDPYKLQKQVDFMEANPDFSMCFARVNVIDQSGQSMPNAFAEEIKDVSTIEDIIMAENTPVPVPTLLFRNVLPRPMPDFYMNTTIGDAAMFLLLTDKGKAKFMDEKMAVYRQHSGGFTKSEFFKNNEYEICYRLYEEANVYFNYKYDDIFRRRLSEISRILLIYGSRNKNGMEKVKYVRRTFPKYMKYAGGVNVKEIAYYVSVLFFPFILKLKAKKA